MEAEGSKTKALGCPRQIEAGLNTGESRWGPRTLPDVAASRASPGQTRGGGCQAWRLGMKSRWQRTGVPPKPLRSAQDPLKSLHLDLGGPARKLDQRRQRPGGSGRQGGLGHPKVQEPS